MKFEDKVAWVTGASSGIGEALAHALSQRGAKVILSSRHADKLQEVRVRCTDPARHIVVPLDLADPSSLESAAAEVFKRFGQVDLLINNGGVSQRSLAKDTSLEVVRRLMEVNFFGPVALTKAVLPSMLERRSGHIVVISSLMGRMATPVRSGYAASKHALHGYFDALRAEVYDDGLRVTVVCPGFVNTNISLNAFTGDGTPANKLDDAVAEGLSPEACAHKILRGVEAEKTEMLIGGKETLGVYLRALSPGLFNRVIRKAKVT